MRTLLVIGIGAGNPRSYDRAGHSRPETGRTSVHPRQGRKENDLAEVRRQICDRFVTTRNRAGSSSMCPVAHDGTVLSLDRRRLGTRRSLKSTRA